VWSDKVETTVPGLVFTEHGKGRVAYVPWDVGGLYYRHSSEAHRGLVADVIDHLLPAGRQVTTNAHPLVEMTLIEQPSRGRSLIHRQWDRASRYGVLPAARDSRHPIDLPRDVRRVRAVALDRELPIESNGRRRSFTLPRLRAWEVIIVE
jgi:hypothetical protein